MVTDKPLEPELARPVPLAPAGADVGLESFVVEHYDRLVRLARLVCHDATDATDAVQAGLERAWRHRGSLRDAEHRSPWLDRIVVREAIRVSKRRRTWLERVLGIDHEADVVLTSADPTPDVALRVVLDGALDRLSPEQRAVVALHLYAGYTVQETADIVGAPLETVRSRLRLARERLRTVLGESQP
jgi:RNA polymerase sigma-70 factor (ECF subfamily)